MAKRPRTPEPKIEATLVGGPEVRAKLATGEIEDVNALIARLTRRDQDREEEVKRLTGMLQQVAEMNSIHGAITAGFQDMGVDLRTLAAQLQPLRDMGKPHRLPEKEPSKAFNRMREAGKGIPLAFLQSVQADTESVRFIGAVRPQPIQKGYGKETAS